MIQISRNGVVIGQYEVGQFSEEIAKGAILPSDWLWTEGMSEWRQVGESVNEVRSVQAAPSANTSKEITSSQKPVRKDWRTDPATDKQINYLSKLGVKIEGSLTKGEASKLIDENKDTPQAIAYQQAKWLADCEAKELQRSDFPSHHILKDIEKVTSEIDSLVKEIESTPEKIQILKGDIEKTKFEIARLEASKTLNYPDWEEELTYKQDVLDELEGEVSILKSDLPDLKGDLSDWKEELKGLVNLRVMFWKFTFRADWIDGELAEELLDYLYWYYPIPSRVRPVFEGSFVERDKGDFVRTRCETLWLG